MTMKISLFAASIMTVGMCLAGSATASQYSKSASERIAEANRASVASHTPGVFVQGAPVADAATLKDMVIYDAAKPQPTDGRNKVKTSGGNEVTTSAR